MMRDLYGPAGPGRGPGGDGWGMHDGMGWGGWLLAGLLVLVLLAAVVAVVLLVVRGTSTRPDPRSGEPAGRSGAEGLLDERYARGEIDEEEYLRRRNVLRGG